MLDINVPIIPESLPPAIQKVAFTLLEKLERSCGWIAKPRGTKADYLRAKEDYLNAIERSSLDVIAKGVMKSNANKIFKNYINQEEIIRKSIINLTASADPNKLSDEWLSFYMNAASMISEEQLKNTWALLLSKACENIQLCSKSLIQKLSIMEKEQAVVFNNLCKFVFVDMDSNVELGKAISSIPIVFFDFLSDEFDYSYFGVSSHRLKYLLELGLITVDANRECVIHKKNIRLRYYNKRVEIYSNGKKIKMGNVMFTWDGYLLSHIAGMSYDRTILEHCEQAWIDKGYKVYID